MQILARGLTFLLKAPIWLYRLFVSPLLPMSCRFLPTCSAYALEALEVHGPLRGSALALRRLARCHPVRWLGAGDGFDPVPAPPVKPLAHGNGFRHTHSTLTGHNTSAVYAARRERGS